MGVAMIWTKFDFDQINFDVDLMQVISVSRQKGGLELPLTQTPVNFSVLMSNG